MVQVHVAGDLVDRVVPADILHIDQRPILLAQHAAVDRPGCQIKARRGVDLAGQRVEPRGPQHRFGVEPNLLEFLHQVAENRALGAARGQRLLFQLVLEIGFAIGADDDGLELFIVVDAGDPVFGRAACSD